MSTTILNLSNFIKYSEPEKADSNPTSEIKTESEVKSKNIIFQKRLMDSMKIQTAVLKWAMGRSKQKDPYNYSNALIPIDGCYEDCVAITEGHVIYFIPKKDFVLDLNKIFSAPPINETAIEAYVNHAPKHESELVSEKVLEGGREVDVFKICGTDQEIWINKQFEKYFALDKCNFKCDSLDAPLYVYEGEILVGLILGINHK